MLGKSNFDISEWILLHLMEYLSGRPAVLAMLCKTAVARKVLLRAWKRKLQIKQATMYSINSAKHFGASVDACLLLCILDAKSQSSECSVYSELSATKPFSKLALHNERLVADIEAVKSFGYLQGSSPLKWRSGVKHDCTKVMELYPVKENFYKNGLGELAQLEPTHLYPMLKSSELMKPRPTPSRFMLVTQNHVGENTSSIKLKSPKTWNYLQKNSDLLDFRASAIYRNRPKYSIFGIGPYSFAPWKVAISGFYKQINFRCIGTFNGRPIVLDDTCYFLPFQNEIDARKVKNLLNSKTANGFFRSLIFWDAKRPITAQILASLDLEILSEELGILLPHDKFSSGTGTKYAQTKIEGLFANKIK